MNWASFVHSVFIANCVGSLHFRAEGMVGGLGKELECFLELEAHLLYLLSQFVFA